MIKPMLARLGPEPFDSPDYIWEVKYDGIRCVAFNSSETYCLQARSGTNKTQLFPELELKTRKPAVLDGELVSASFNAIQHRVNRINGISQAVRDYPVVYKVFDVIQVEDVDLRGMPLRTRKEILADLVIPSSNVEVARFLPDGKALFQSILESGGEGVIGKLKAGTYREGKRDWLKVKCNRTGEFVICGYTPGTGWRESTFGALILARLDDGVLTYVGSVGTGFTDAEIADIHNVLLSLRTDKCPFPVPPPETGAVWVNPEVKVRVKYLELTNDGRLRFPAYKGIINR